MRLLGTVPYRTIISCLLAPKIKNLVRTMHTAIKMQLKLLGEEATLPRLPLLDDDIDMTVSLYAR